MATTRLLVAAATVVTMFVLSLRPFHPLLASLRPFGDYTSVERQARHARVAKVTAVYGGNNDLVEAALQSHVAHNRVHGYEMFLMKEKIMTRRWSKPAYLLSLVLGELAKPLEERLEWLMWVSPETVILNKHIPLEIFLPPDDFEHIHFIGTHAADEFCDGAFFLHVHEWSVGMLLAALVPPGSDGTDPGRYEHARGIELATTSQSFMRGVAFQPPTLFNAHQLDLETSTGTPGNLLTQFHDMDGDKWLAMTQKFSELRFEPQIWNVPLQQTTYEADVAAYWDQLRRTD